jgi:hypothetical protein
LSPECRLRHATFCFLLLKRGANRCTIIVRGPRIGTERNKDNASE